MLRFRHLAATSLLLVTACGDFARQETPAYFSETTGLKLCDTATIKNEHDPATDNAGIGVVYVVSLRMSRSCERDFLRQVENMQRRLRPQGYPTGPDDSWIEVEPKGDWWIVRYTT